MKIELRKLKTYPRLSEETLAFNAEIWIDGNYAGDAQNSGHGDDIRFRFDDRTVEQAFYAYCKSLPPVDCEYGPLAMDADLYVSDLIAAEDHRKWLVRPCRNKVVFTMPGAKKGEYRTVKIRPTETRATVEQFVRTKYPMATIVNP